MLKFRKKTKEDRYYDDLKLMAQLRMIYRTQQKAIELSKETMIEIEALNEKIMARNQRYFEERNTIPELKAIK